MDLLLFGVLSDPLPTSEAFYEFFMRTPVSGRDKAYENGLLPYDSPLVFTHFNLQFTNILITPRNINEHPHNH